MPETTVASNKWGIQTGLFKRACDNTLRLDNSAGLSAMPVKKNRKGICAPSCEVCITPFPNNVKAPCFCSEVPLYYEVDLPSPILGISAFSNCLALSGGQFKFGGTAGATCVWSTPLQSVPICHTRNDDGSYGCGRYSQQLRKSLTLATLTPTQANLQVIIFILWSDPKFGENSYSPAWIWSATVNKCFGEWSLPLLSVTPAYGNYSPAQFTWPASITVKSLQKT